MSKPTGKKVTYNINRPKAKLSIDNVILFTLVSRSYS